MNIEKIKELLESKEYPDTLIQWAVKFYPIMCENFGTEKVNNFFETYKLVPRDKIGANSGCADKINKTVGFDWVGKNLHEALTLFIHEAAHAIGGLEVNYDSMLMEGHIYRESFLGKLEEGLVSEKQNELEHGEVNYTYIEMYNLDGEYYENDFKTSLSNKYTINSVYYKLFKLLLGNSNLLIKNMFANTIEEKNKYYNEAISILKEILTPEEFDKLIDCICCFTLNYSYRGDTDLLLDNCQTDEARKEYIEGVKKLFPKTFSIYDKRNLYNKNIFDAIDDLSLLVINVLIRRIQNDNYDSLDSLKEACSYFVKIDNNNPNILNKRNELKEILLNKMFEMFPNLKKWYYQIDEMNYDDKFVLLTQIASLSCFSNNIADDIVFYYEEDVLHISIGKYNYILNKSNIYSCDIIIPGIDTPIGYRLYLKEENNNIFIEDKKIK